jgi:carbohydrate kinase (thermoresistant glucokinase family)
MIVLLMGVSGAGKTTVGEALAAKLGWRFLDADDFHPPENVAKMASGTPLEDADRWPWLDRMNEELLRSDRKGESAVIACSALKESYRRRLIAGLERCRIVYLHGDVELIRDRATQRQHRFMPASLLDSQFAVLEPPAHAITVDVAGKPADVVRTIVERLKR